MSIIWYALFWNASSFASAVHVPTVTVSAVIVGAAEAALSQEREAAEAAVRHSLYVECMHRVMHQAFAMQWGKLHARSYRGSGCDRCGFRVAVLLPPRDAMCLAKTWQA